MDTDHRFSNAYQNWLIAMILAAIFLLKWSGILIIPFIIFYYFNINDEKPLKNKIKKILIILSPITVCVLAYYLNKFLTLGYFLPDIQDMISGGVHPNPAEYYITNLHNILYLPVLIVLLAYGVFIIIKTSHPRRHLLFVYLLVTVVGLSLNAVKTIRYSLITIPVLMIITGLGLDSLLHRIKLSPSRIQTGRLLSLLLCVLLYFSLYPQTAATLEKSFSTSSGLKEAGVWVKQHARDPTLIICQNLRPLRYFTGINEKRFGGQLILLPPKKKDFENILKKESTNIIVVVDLWSESNPSEFSPFWQEQREAVYFNHLGFRLVHEIKRPIHTTQTNETELLPVVKIFEK